MGIACRRFEGTPRRAVCLPYARDVVVLSDDVKLADGGRLHSPAVVVAALLLSIAVVLGYLGWVLPCPGGSLAVPAVIVFGIGSVAALAMWTGPVGSDRRGRRM